MKKEKGITLIALIITIIILLILAGITIQLFVSNGIFSKARESNFKQDSAKYNEELTLYLANSKLQSINETEIPEIIINEMNGEEIQKKYIKSLDKKYYDKLAIKDSNLIYIGVDEIEIKWAKDLEINGIIGREEDSLYSKEKGVNKPNIGTNMTPIYFDNNGEIVKTNEEDNNWYNYEKQNATTQNGGTSKWANCVLLDGSQFVWIPRYAYKINYSDEQNKSSGGTIDIIFLVGTTNSYYDENEIYHTKLPEGYMVHPCFTDDSSNKYENGGWDKEISGIWIGKYEAGYNLDNNTLKDSNIKYSITTNTYYGTVKPGEDYIKYPVFKANTYSNGKISLGEAYSLCKSLNSLNNPFGLTSKENTHLIKNGEWGACAYLAYSNYGRNTTLINRNSTNVNQNRNKFNYCNRRCMEHWWK